MDNIAPSSHTSPQNKTEEQERKSNTLSNFLTNNFVIGDPTKKHGKKIINICTKKFINDCAMDIKIDDTFPMDVTAYVSKIDFDKVNIDVAYNSKFFSTDVLKDVTIRYFNLLIKYPQLKGASTEDKNFLDFGKYFLTDLLQKGELCNEDKKKLNGLSESNFQEIKKFISMVRDPDAYVLLSEEKKQ